MNSCLCPKDIEKTKDPFKLTKVHTLNLLGIQSWQSPMHLLLVETKKTCGGFKCPYLDSRSLSSHKGPTTPAALALPKGFNLRFVFWLQGKLLHLRCAVTQTWRVSPTLKRKIYMCIYIYNMHNRPQGGRIYIPTV